MAEPPTSRALNARRTRAEILAVATAEFARNGLAGARVDEIAALTHTTKRMIYYYFGSKELLYLAVLQQALTTLRPEVGLPVEVRADPLGVLVRIAGLTFDRYRAHPDPARVVITENVSGGEHFALAENPFQAELDLLERAVAAGIEGGVIRAGVRACDLLMIIDSICQFAISNRHTYHQLCGHDPLGEAFSETARQMLTDVVTAYLSPLRSGG